jgi:hypothetical protein
MPPPSPYHAAAADGDSASDMGMGMRGMNPYTMQHPGMRVDPFASRPQFARKGDYGNMYTRAMRNRGVNVGRMPNRGGGGKERIDSSSEDFDFAFDGNANARRRGGGGGGELPIPYNPTISGVFLLIWVSRSYANAGRIKRFT